MAVAEGGEKKAACLFKGTGGWSRGESGGKEGGGGSESSNTAQQYQPPNTEQAPQTLQRDGREDGLSLHPFPLGLFSSFHPSQGIFLCFVPPSCCIISPPDELLEYLQSVEEPGVLHTKSGSLNHSLPHS